MRLEKFTAKGIHGYLDFNIRFRKDVTFLTGINGSGKTTAINAIVALISPDLATLSNLVYDRLSISLIHEREAFTLSATSIGDEFNILASGIDDPLTLRKFNADNDVLPSRQAEHEAEYFKELMNVNSNHPVIRLISRLPTPMFLGLDRRARFEAADRRRVFPVMRAARPARNVFSASLSRSLLDAAELAARSNRDAIISASRIGDELRRELILKLLTVSPQSYAQVKIPARSDLAEIEKIRRDIESLPRILNLPLDDIQRSITPFLDVLQAAAQDIPSGTKIPNVFSSGRDNQTIIDALFTWGANISQLKRIRAISEAVESFNVRRRALMEPVQKYTKLVNAFLSDSGKSIDFDEDGYVHVNFVEMDSKKRILTVDMREISTLSSGEAQIFVILTHLSFNENAKSANVFIIDEPELSLHVLWQELFVESVVAANSNIQYIMATHSPSIILDKRSHCVDVQRKVAVH